MMADPAENGLLTEAERNALDDSLADSGCHGFQGDHPDLYAAVERIVAARQARPWRPSDGDSRCQECGHEYEPWFTDNSLWNEVMGGSAYGGDPGGYLCPRCFAIRARDTFPRLVWRFIPQWNGRAEAMDWPTADAATHPISYRDRS